MAAWYILYPGESCNLVVPKLNSFRCRFVPCAACDNTSPSPKSHLFCLTNQLRMASCSTWFLSCHLGRETPNRWAARELPKAGICSGIRGCNLTLPSGMYLFIGIYAPQYLFACSPWSESGSFKLLSHHGIEISGLGKKLPRCFESVVTNAWKYPTGSLLQIELSS